MTATCSCSEAMPHILGTRRSADGSRVDAWSDGAVTIGIAKVYVVRGSRGSRLAQAIAAAWRTLDRACLYNANEMRGLALASRQIVARRGKETTP